MSDKRNSKTVDKPRSDADFWRKRTAAELAAEQGVGLWPGLDAVPIDEEDSWDDEDFESFLQSWRRFRKTGYWERPGQ